MGDSVNFTKSAPFMMMNQIKFGSMIKVLFSHQIYIFHVCLAASILASVLTSRATASVGDMAKWQKKEFILTELPQDVFDEYTKTCNQSRRHPIYTNINITLPMVRCVFTN